MTYLNLTLRIWKSKSSENRYRVAISEVDGHVLRELPAQSISPLNKVVEAFNPKKADSLTDKMRVVLGDALLGGEASYGVRDALQRVDLEQAEGIRFRLLTDDFMQGLPWEGARWDLRDEDGRVIRSLILGTAHDLTIIRAESDIMRRPPVSLRLPLRVLLVIGAQTGGINVREEKRVVESLQVRPQVEVEVATLGENDGVTLSQLKETLAQGWHIVHYVGHSGIDEDGTGWTLLRDEYGDEVHVAADEFTKALSLNRKARLVVLNSCQSLGVAQALVEAGVQAVIAMRTDIDDYDAHKFSEGVYASLLGEVEPGRIDIATQLGRAALQPPLDAAPILFMRPVDGRIFRISRNPDYWEPVVHHYVAGKAAELVDWRSKYVPLPIVGETVTPALDHEAPRDMEDVEYVRHIIARCPVQRAMEEMNNLIVLGDGGAGKTTALQFRAWSRFVEFSEVGSADRLPVLLNLAAMEANQSLVQAIAAETHITVQVVERYVRDGAIELLADGFNEIPEKAVDWVLNELDKFVRGEHAITNRLIVTSRPTVAQWQSLAIPSVTITFLGRESIWEMIDLIAPSPLAADLLKQRIPLQDDVAWQDPTSVLRMTSLPLVVKMLSDLAGRAAEMAYTEDAETFQLPKTRGELFNRWTHFQVESWNDRESLRAKVKAQPKLDGLIRLAAYMLDQRMGTVARREDVLAAWAGALPEGALDELIDASVLDKRGDTKVTWWHQGIRDSRAASHLHELLKQGQLPSQYLNNREWDDSFVYLTGLMSTSEVVELIGQHLSGYPFLAARCYMETRQVHDLNALKANLLKAMGEGHRNTQEITGDIEQLEALVREGVEESATLFGHLVLGKILETQGRYAEAIAECDAAASLPASDFSDEIDVLCHAGSARRRRGDHAGAVP